MGILIIVTVFLISSVKSSLITIEQGTLNGTQLTARNGKIFNAFYGIPFAQPPVGNLRFKPPVEAGPWTGIRDATQLPPVCVQISIETANTVIGSEDCLYLDVYTPQNAQEGNNLPVIVYIFGGRFKEGYTYQNGPQYIMQHDVIMVFPNFRMGVLGFLSTGDTIIPGNFGLKDQTLALKWVQKNIRRFGGDPDRVTFHGHSSGATMVHLHTLSPSSTGLFHKIIIQSGVGFCRIEYFGPDVAQATAKEFAIKAGCPSVNSSRDMYECFMAMDPNTTVLVPESMYIWDKDPDATFRPTIEDENSEQAFLTEIPNYGHYSNTDMPWLIGMTTGECAYKVARYLGNGSGLATEIDSNFKLLFPITMQYLWDTETKHLNYISRTIRAHYFGNREINAETADEMTSMFSDGLYGVCTMDTIHSYPGQKYVYLYNYRGNYSMLVQNVIGYYDKFLGISHSNEVHLLFQRPQSIDLLTDRDITFSDELIKRWINFVYSSDPNLPMEINENVIGFWEPMTSDRIEFMFLDWNGTMKTNMYEEMYQFWKSLPLGSKYYNFGRS